MNGEKLVEYLFCADNGSIARAYEIECAEQLKKYIALKKNKKSKVFNGSHIYLKVGIAAACLLFVVGVAICTREFSDSNKNEKKLYIVSDNFDDYGLELEEIKSRNKKYISNVLQEKMQEYEGDNVIYHVLVEIIITREDDNEFVVSDEEVLALNQERIEAFTTYENILSSLRGVTEEAKRIEIVEEAQNAEKVAKDLQREYEKQLSKLTKEYCDKIANQRFEVARKLSRFAPVQIFSEDGVSLYSAYNKKAYFMGLTEDDINNLAEAGGFVFRLATSEEITKEYFQDE